MIIENIPTQDPVLEEEDVKEFIKSRNISPEDFRVIKELSLIPKRFLIMELHNFFSFSRERSAAEFDKLISSLDQRSEATDPELYRQRRRLYELFLEFIKKYNWAVAWNLEVVLERRKIPETTLKRRGDPD
ncbi:MAG: hypothetical protein A3B99_02870 [Candidatus Yanofskybacteria bacterium RIFCSPHIGHO2_02_FULL_44_12b]|uniref:Uncharacterized protein n=2 Tax=Candidatus Yanofskyibacteriota TaxID=1752733 RepID=A0A1F8GPI2_9BACT|nr:MAG: hypothetical protein UW79_C0025G0007 [Candidatus Yanofskybacteria bacterium GW2011_GWA2_44_9]OGN15942.1 MAG: hypothetical protein A3B99_02870 [Candidatus Yanofskybacteria bacterium RIFCSPHIGHO2_02_FULL_44_12b]OGN26890.1 MAG: hypothetical protein A2925_01305 [Candidatus Yanofskybacteria bacterium RIFCSPLOWO2_01_FULL_44_22]